MPEIEISLKVNGRVVRWHVEPGETLLEALHHHHLKGTKLICGTGDCCGCGVILDGCSINACCMLAAQADGGDLLTIEGLAQDGKLHPIQEAFAQEGAAQCGYCTPGFIMRTYAFLQEHPHPTEDEVRHALAGNICRCTGYVKPVAAVLRAAEALEGENKMYRFLVIIEKGNENYGAYSPDLPGCVAVGDTIEEVEKNMQEAIAMHLKGMIEDHEPIPVPQSTARYMNITIPDSAA